MYVGNHFDEQHILTYVVLNYCLSFFEFKSVFET